MSEPLKRLTEKDVQWIWGHLEQAAFKKLKDILSAVTVLAHLDPSLPVGISCNASEVGLEAVPLRRYSVGSESPVALVTKTLLDAIAKFKRRLYVWPLP